MAATYPSGIRAFPTYANGDQVTPATINDPNLEITAIETGLIDGLAHDLLPDATGNQRNLGTPEQQWYDLVLSHNAIVAGTLTVTGGITGLLTVSSLTVTGNASVGGALAVAGGLDVNGAVHIQSTLSVAGLVNFDGNFIVAGLSTLLTASIGTLGVQNGLSVGGGVAITGDVGIGGLLTANGGILTTSLAAQSVAVGVGGLSINGNTSVAGNLFVTGSPTISSFTQVNAGMAVTGALTVGTSLGVGGNVGIGGSLIAGPTNVAAIDAGQVIVSYRQPGVTVSTSPANIYTTTLINGADVGGLVIVSGCKAGDASVQFTDWVLVISNTVAQLTAGQSKGAAASRVYAWSGLNLILTMGADTYKVCALPVLVATPGP